MTCPSGSSYDFSRADEEAADLHEVVSKIATSEIETEDGVWEGISFVDGDS
eukprot:gene12181-14256_t